MLSSQLFASPWSLRGMLRRRPRVLAVFSFRYDAHLVPDLIENLRPIVDGYVAYDDRAAAARFSDEVRRKRALLTAARDMHAAWALCIDPDERLEHGTAARISPMTATVEPILWRFHLREMYAPDAYRVDGIWGTKRLSCLFPLLDGQVFSEQQLHAPRGPVNEGYRKVDSSLNLYHLKMISRDRRVARRVLYETLDPNGACQPIGYDYLTDDSGAVLEAIPPGREYRPPHRERGGLWMVDPTTIAPDWRPPPGSPAS